MLGTVASVCFPFSVRGSWRARRSVVVGRNSPLPSLPCLPCLSCLPWPVSTSGEISSFLCLATVVCYPRVSSVALSIASINSGPCSRDRDEHPASRQAYHQAGVLMLQQLVDNWIMTQEGASLDSPPVLRVADFPNPQWQTDGFWSSVSRS